MMPVMDGVDFLLEMRAAKDLTEEDRRVLSGRVEQIVEKGACTHEHLMARIRRLVTGESQASLA